MFNEFRRMGNMVAGTEDVKSHDWFSLMNFDDLYQKRVSPYASRLENSILLIAREERFSALTLYLHYGERLSHSIVQN